MMQRRTFLAGTTVAAAATILGPANADVLPLGDLPNWRYPDPRVEVLDKRFKARIGNAAIERIATGFRWPRALPIFATAAICCGAIFPTIASCVGSKTMAM
jgi:hypothetical protein